MAMFLANCSCLGAGKAPAETIADALSRVDPRTLATVVGASCALRDVEHACGIPEGQWRDYVRHSQEIAVSCGALADVLGPGVRSDVTSVSGLTHDVGRIVMMAAAGEQTASFVGSRPDLMGGIVENERTAYGMDHCVLGCELFRRWGFSDAMQQGILRHHTPLMGGEFNRLGGIVFVAHFVATSDFTGEIITRMLRPELLDRMGLNTALLERARDVYRVRRAETVT
jgi:HD-like signal output (HDOD) protein